MTRLLHLANHTTIVQDSTVRDPITDLLRTESIHYSPLGDGVANDFTSAVVATYSGLDMPRTLFDFVSRKPFGQPDLPRDRHFSSSLAGGIRPDHQQDLPRAIPNIQAKHFQALYDLRNDLIHNYGHDNLRAAVYIGVGLRPVLFHTLQYAQYLTRQSRNQTGRLYYDA